MNNYIETTTRRKKESTRDKITNVLKTNKKGLPLMEIGLRGDIRSGGNLHSTIRFMIRAKELVKFKCPYCDSTEIYKLT